MSSFHDYPSFSDRRRSDRRKKIIIAAASTLGITILVVVGVVGAILYTKDSEKHRNPPPKQVSVVSKSVQMICSATDYASTCESALSKAVNSSSPEPKDLVAATVAVIVEEAKKAFQRSEMFKTKDPMIRGAIEDCKELFSDAKEELESSLRSITAGGLEQLPKKADDIGTWLSAVVSYQQTCIDGFPEGELKKKMKVAMQRSGELTSNAMAIIKQAAKFFSTVKLSNFNRRLLSDEEEEKKDEVVVGEDGLPSWVGDGDRRMLGEFQWMKPKPIATVAKDGSGDYKTISAALASMPNKYQGRYVIYVKEGVYEETVIVTKKMVNVTMYGDGAKRTIVTGSKNFVDGTRTFQTATFAALGAGFMAVDMAFRNTAGAAKHQAVALRVQSDRSVFLHCRIEGYQDTLYAQTHRQFYRGCVISGTIDFIFGDAAVVIQNSVIVVRRPLSNQNNIITASGRADPHENTGIILHNCRIVADRTLEEADFKVRTYLGRPWKAYSKAVIMESRIAGFIDPKGYTPWEGEFGLKTLYYAEYNNTGDGAGVAGRVKWPGFRVIKRTSAAKYTPEKFIQGERWIRTSGVPVRLGLYY